MLGILYLCIVLNEIATDSLDDWFNQLNSQYYMLNHYAAIYTWELGVNSKNELQAEASEFGEIRLKWKNERCDEAKSFIDKMTPTQKRMTYLLCRGPKYTTYQARELSTILDTIQAIYTETQICLPKAFDVCLNYNRIWDYTYLKNSVGDISPLNFSSYKPNAVFDYNPLHLFDGKTTADYYVFRGRTSGNLERNEVEIDSEIRKSALFCLDIEPDLESIMQGKFANIHRLDCGLPADVIFRWTWEAWRLAVGPEIRQYYPNAVSMMNTGARNNDYKDIGESWREELEMKSLQLKLKELWLKIKPFYKLLHGVLRNALRKKYDGDEVIGRTEPLPAHLLGDMWSSDWSAYQELLMPFNEINIEKEIHNTKWSTKDMVKRAEDFYLSLGLNPMTKLFWNNSVFSKASNKTKCHGSAGNMFQKNDFRMVVCPDKTLYGLYEIVHEMGHIQYYMHLVHQPPLFQDATNSAIGEAIGDAIFLAMLTPQHLNRLQLLPDKFLVPKNVPKMAPKEKRIVHELQTNMNFLKAPTDEELNYLIGNHLKQNDQIQDNETLGIDLLTVDGEPFPNFAKLNKKMKNFINFKENSKKYYLNEFDGSILLQMALAKIPQIPFEYILDVYRWSLFSGEITFDEVNEKFWDLSLKEQGIHAPEWNRRHELFDAAAKFHFADNTPYVRYFLSSILQIQIFKGLCEYNLFGKFHSNQKLTMPLHRCDIYGSKRAGRLLKKAMKLGSSAHWSQVLHILTGEYDISVEPLLEYYRPLIIWLEEIVLEFEIPLGW